MAIDSHSHKPCFASIIGLKQKKVIRYTIWHSSCKKYDEELNNLQRSSLGPLEQRPKRFLVTMCKSLTTSSYLSWALDYSSVASVDSRFSSKSCLNLSASNSSALFSYNVLQITGQN